MTMTLTDPVTASVASTRERAVEALRTADPAGVLQRKPWAIGNQGVLLRCSCAVIAEEFGYDLRSGGDMALYEFIEDLGFSYGLIAGWNDVGPRYGAYERVARYIEGLPTP
jgi:hypothetical protein